MPAMGHHGGGVYSSNSSALIEDCLFVDNSGDPYGGYGVGGAIVAFGGSTRIVDCTFTGSLADQGGAVALYDPLAVEIVDCDFMFNNCTATVSGKEGAALYVQNGTASVSGSRFEGNGTTYLGGAIYAENADLTLTDNVFADNLAQDKGGAIAVFGGTLSVLGGEITGNTVAITSGAGLYAIDADVDLRNVLVSGNIGPAVGAGVYLESIGVATVENCAFLYNDCGATNMAAFGIMFCDSLLFRNNVVVDNVGGGIGGAVTTLSLDYNLVWNNGVDYFVFTPGAHDISADPLFVDAAGGDFGLALHSPRLDRGDPEAACNDVDASRNDMGVCGGPAAVTSAPAAVQGALLTDLGDGRLEVGWDPNTEPDVDRYVVYNSTDDPFVPAPELVVADVLHPVQSWIDETPSGGYYLVVAVDATGHVGGYSEQVGGGTPVAGDPTPRTLAVTRVTPNPFNPRTKVAFDVPRSGPVSVRIHDMRGRVVRRLVNGDLDAGRHEVIWNGRDDAGAAVATGVYLVRISDGSRTASAKLMLAK